MNDVERESLKEEMRNILGESRMVIPGAQALFGFQTMAVFNERFSELPPAGVTAYLVGLGLLALSIALLMAPASYHRIAERGQVSPHMVLLSSRFLSFGMIPLMLGMALDIYVVCLAALGDARTGVIAAVVALCVFGSLWFVYPLRKRQQVEASRARDRQRRDVSAA